MVCANDDITTKNYDSFTVIYKLHTISEFPFTFPHMGEVWGRSSPNPGILGRLLSIHFLYKETALELVLRQLCVNPSVLSVVSPESKNGFGSPLNPKNGFGS